LLEPRKNISPVAVIVHSEKQMQSGNGIQMNLDLQALAAADGNGSRAVSVGNVGIVGDGIGDVERSIEICAVCVGGSGRLASCD